MSLRFLISDGYDPRSRANLTGAGMQPAGTLYEQMLLRELPDARADIFFPSDPGVRLPTGAAVGTYDGILWTGCNATIFHDEPRVHAQIELSKTAFELGVPQFGSCWGIQMAAVAAGGTVEKNPRGREMGVGRRIRLTEAGRTHPMTVGRAEVYQGFESHDDYITRVPPGAVVLAGNDHSPIQAMVVRHGRGEFWGVQYHPEYDLHEMARLTVARTEKLLRLGFYRTPEELHHHVEQMEALYAEPDRKDLRWQLDIGDEILDPIVRTHEFSNWIREVVGG